MLAPADSMFQLKCPTTAYAADYRDGFWSLHISMFAQLSTNVVEREVKPVLLMNDVNIGKTCFTCAVLDRQLVLYGW